MCLRRQRFTRSGPGDLAGDDRDGRGCVAANGECAGRSRRAALARGCWLVALSFGVRARSRRVVAREGASERAQLTLVE